MHPCFRNIIEIVHLTNYSWALSVCEETVFYRKKAMMLELTGIKSGTKCFAGDCIPYLQTIYALGVNYIYFPPSWCLGSNLGPLACWTSALPLSYTPTPSLYIVLKILLHFRIFFLFWRQGLAKLSKMALNSHYSCLSSLSSWDCRPVLLCLALLVIIVDCSALARY